MDRDGERDVVIGFRNFSLDQNSAACLCASGDGEGQDEWRKGGDVKKKNK